MGGVSHQGNSGVFRNPLFKRSESCDTSKVERETKTFVRKGVREGILVPGVGIAREMGEDTVGRGSR
jgi:hypothetical protein